MPFFWAGALLQSSRAQRTSRRARRCRSSIFRSAAQRVALHVDEVLGNQEVVVKNLGPQLSRLPGLAGMSVLASGAVVLIYNPVALAAVHGEQARAAAAPTGAAAACSKRRRQAPSRAGGCRRRAPQVPLVLVVDDSITVRRVTQRLLQREGYRVALAADGLQALERLQQERPAVVLSDIEMPRMDGFDLARNIRADESLADLPIIMITSRIAEKHREHARATGRQPLPGQAVLGRGTAEPGAQLHRRRRARPDAEARLPCALGAWRAQPSAGSLQCCCGVLLHDRVALQGALARLGVVDDGLAGSSRPARRRPLQFHRRGRPRRMDRLRSTAPPAAAGSGG